MYDSHPGLPFGKRMGRLYHISKFLHPFMWFTPRPGPEYLPEPWVVQCDRDRFVVDTFGEGTLPPG